MNENYWNRQATSYDRNIKDRLEINGRILEASRKYCYSDAIALELGCGTGSFTVDFAKYVEHIDAIDAAEAMLRIAAEKSETMNIRNISWRVEPVEEALNGKEQYDLIFAFYFLSYFRNPKKLIQDIYERLEHGGYFISVTECLGERMGLLQRMNYLAGKMGIKPYQRALKRLDLVELIKYAGFQIVRSENFGGDCPHYYIVARKKD